MTPPQDDDQDPWTEEHAGQLVDAILEMWDWDGNDEALAMAASELANYDIGPDGFESCIALVRQVAAAVKTLGEADPGQ